MFERCAFEACRFAEAYFRRARFVDCKADGANFAGARLHETALTDSSFRYANFTDGAWQRVDVRGCMLREAALLSLRLSRSVFQECDLTGADLFRTALCGLDLSTCTLDGIVLSADCAELRGASIGALQAVELARLLGVKIV